MKKDALLAQIRAERLIGLVAADIGADLVSCARALSEGGFHCLEIAMTTPGVITSLERASQELPDFRFGLGTVLDVDTARRGILAGASFIVTPSPRPEVITLCRRYHVAVISGAFTPADIKQAHAAGADAVKVFPGEQFGPAYIKSLKAEFPELTLIPIGGVTPQTAAEFIRAGATSLMAGNALIPEHAWRTRDWALVTEQARAFAQALATLGE